MSCSGDDQQSNEYILGEDNMSLFLEGKIFKYTVQMYLDGDRVYVVKFGSDGQRDETKFCGINGETCNTSPQGSCFEKNCRTPNVIIDTPTYLEYDDGEVIRIIDGKLYFNYSGNTNYELIDSSLQEIEELKNEAIYECESSTIC